MEEVGCSEGAVGYWSVSVPSDDLVISAKHFTQIVVSASLSCGCADQDFSRISLFERPFWVKVTRA